MAGTGKRQHLNFIGKRAVLRGSNGTSHPMSTYNSDFIDTIEVLWALVTVGAIYEGQKADSPANGIAGSLVPLRGVVPAVVVDAHRPARVETQCFHGALLHTV